MPPVDWAYLWGTKGESGFGSRSTAQDVTEGIDLSSRTAIVTGATSGIGLETARVLAMRGAHVVIPARTLKAAEQAKSAIISELPDAKVSTGELDLGSFASIRTFVDEFKSLNAPLNILINNAGVICRGLQLSEEKMELQFAINHLGHFLLTKLLLDTMIRTSEETRIEGRIVNISSKAHAILTDSTDFQKLNTENRMSNWHPTLYAGSKLANILHVKELSRQLKERRANITANALHPGVVHTQIFRNLRPAIQSYISICSLLMRPVPQGAATTCYVATHSRVNGISGRYFEDCNEATCSPLANDMALAKELWNFSESFIEARNKN
ncbi:hypothetical protein SELMODRAFT_108387 [Selaginella moellendorffii]|uniref:Uncharacterized protein n=1 Tax=Selaginella moellendorffii TaxID=88036 RepID=D8S4D1_SELML|nr:short-chain dehydrogenase TIC 32, chloroplastic [Selaginella moellendorffii]EFJ20923.1 hypothetical protein SELMODRAFT_108387 [Selaginella moellendorffii]|eukprot:XP_002978266.1 short-chain dehydrogenase TIC 32, chloroplastic [Selaginella moellendorffii]